MRENARSHAPPPSLPPSPGDSDASPGPSCELLRPYVDDIFAAPRSRGLHSHPLSDGLPQRV